MGMDVELRGVTKSYGAERAVVRELSFRLEAGSTLCIIGTSGCGKTTTLKLINRLIEPTGGEILIGGADAMQQDVIELRRSIGYVIQDGGLFPHMTIAENVGTVARLQGWDAGRTARRVDELLELVNLAPEVYRNRRPDELSGGQKQRVGVARSLMVDPPLILMDEPFGALDPITRTGLQDEFVRLKAELGKTIVFVTHDMPEAFKLGDQILLMDGGERQQMGSPSELLERPANGFVADFMRTHAQHKPAHELAAGDVLVSDTVTLQLDGDGRADVQPALRRLDELRRRWAVVVDGTRRVVGLLDRAALEEGAGGSLTSRVRELPIRLRGDTALSELLDSMLEHGITELPVLDDRDGLLGMVTRGSLVESFEAPAAHREGLQ